MLEVSRVSDAFRSTINQFAAEGLWIVGWRGVDRMRVG